MVQYLSRPRSGDILSVSQGDIQNNFTYIAQALGKDHNISFGTDSTTPAIGLHDSASFVTNHLPPLTSGASSMLWGDNQRLWWQNSTTGPVQMTGNFAPVNASPGYTFLPGGLMMAWGIATLTGGSTVIIFPNGGFSAPYYSVTLTPRFLSSGNTARQLGLADAPSSTQFRIISDYTLAVCTNVTWIAIGTK